MRDGQGLVPVDSKGKQHLSTPKKEGRKQQHPKEENGSTTHKGRWRISAPAQRSREVQGKVVVLPPPFEWCCVFFAFLWAVLLSLGGAAFSSYLLGGVALYTSSFEVVVLLLPSPLSGGAAWSAQGKVERWSLLPTSFWVELLFILLRFSALAFPLCFMSCFVKFSYISFLHSIHSKEGRKQHHKSSTTQKGSVETAQRGPTKGAFPENEVGLRFGTIRHGLARVAVCV